jgi:NADPH-dependent 2,4-dienoyl-CoA reductase/sulfur reductase-like enzyme
MAEKTYPIAILGGGVVAGYAAQELVNRGLKPGDLCIVSAENQLPYDRPPLSKKFLVGKKQIPDILINPPEFYEQHGIAVRLNTPVEQVDLRNRILYIRSGERIEFEKLLIATGTYPRKLKIPGSDLRGVFYLRRAENAIQIRDQMVGSRRAVVIGGGYIGMEVGASLTQEGLNVTLVNREDRLLTRLFTPEMSAFFERYYRDRNVTILPNSEVAEIVGSDRVLGVTLTSGQQIPADMVVIGVGVEPATRLFEGSGLVLDNGIVVNKYLQTNLADIYAAGDVANYYDVLFKKQRRIEHWDNAVNQGKYAARSMTGQEDPEYMMLPYFFSDVFDLSYEFWGDTDNADQIVLRGDVANNSFSVWWLNAEQVDAVFILNRPDEERELAPDWIRFRRRVTPRLLLDASQPLRQIETRG